MMNIACIRWMVIAVLIALGLVAGSAQTSRSDPRRIPPTAELDKLKHFLGEYTTSFEQGTTKLPGTMEIRSAIKGFYIERINLTRGQDGKIDSEIRSLITWDPDIGQYLIWRFVPLLPQRKHDGVGRFEGNVFVEEYEFEGTNKQKQILRNRITTDGKDDIRIVNEIQQSDGTIKPRGVIVAKRVNRRT